MLEFNNLVTGYESAVLALVLVFAYFVLVMLMLRIPGSRHISVPRYEPPRGASPGVAAWLLERGKLPRAMAAALVNMAAKGYLKIEQTEDLCSLTKLETESSEPLEPEEDALARALFRGYDCFEFDQTTPQLVQAVTAFRWALRDTTYFSAHIALSIPAWTLSCLGTFLALARGNYFTHLSKHFGIYSTFVIPLTFGCFIVAVRTLPGPLEKIASRLPGSTAPQRPWTGADSRPFTFLLMAVGGVALIALLSTTVAALLTAAFLVINAAFFYALQGPTAAGREVLAQLADYRKFLSEVEADAISRVNPADHAPAQLHTKNAYALAFHLDLGWGEQFVTSIADLIECAQVFGKIRDGRDPAG